MVGPNFRELMQRFGVHDGAQDWRMHSYYQTFCPYPPYGCFMFSVLQPTEDERQRVLVLNGGMIRPIAPEFLKPLRRRKDSLSNLLVEDHCTRRLIGALRDSRAADLGPGEDPPDRHVMIGGRLHNLEITSITLDQDRHIEAHLDRVRQAFEKVRTPSRLKGSYVSLYANTQLQVADDPERVWNGPDIIRRIALFLGSREFSSQIPSLKTSGDAVPISGTPFLVRVSNASFPFRSNFYLDKGFELINACEIVVTSADYSKLLQRAIDRKDIESNDSLLVVHGMPDKKGLVYPREGALQDLAVAGLVKELRRPKHIHDLFLMSTWRMVEWYEFGDASPSLVGKFSDPIRQGLDLDGAVGTYVNTLNMPLFEGHSVVGGESPENR